MTGFENPSVNPDALGARTAARDLPREFESMRPVPIGIIRWSDERVYEGSNYSAVAASDDEPIPALPT